jgi:hypothetical protein
MYTNSKHQISLEEAYRKVHSKDKEKKDCCKECSRGKKCVCEDEKLKESADVPPSIDAALDASKQIVYDGDDAQSELKEFLPLVFSSAASDLGFDDIRAKHIAQVLLSKLDMNELENRISDLHSEKEKLTKEAKYSMEAQVELNRVIDQILKEGTYEALDYLYQNPENEMPPSRIVKSLEKKIQDRIASRK